jgi:hypothetical protein
MSRHELLRGMVSLTRSIEGLRRDLRSAARREVLAPIGTASKDSGQKAAPALPAKRNRVLGNKLDVDRVRAIKVRIAQGDRDQAIAADFQIDRSLVGQIRRGRAWANVAVEGAQTNG